MKCIDEAFELRTSIMKRNVRTDCKMETGTAGTACTAPAERV